MRTLVLLMLSLLTSATSVHARSGVMESTKRTAELQIRNLVEPLLDKYCREECKLMSVEATVDYAAPEQLSPGFEDVDPRASFDLAPASAQVKMLVDEKVGPVSRGKLLDLVHQYLDTLNYPVRVDTEITRFPQPIGSAGKVAELRERLSKQFRTTLDELFQQFCPNRCMLADFGLETEVVNVEEAQYGQPGEFLEDGGVAVRIKNIEGTILVDSSLTPEERNNVVEMAKLKTSFLRNVNLTQRAMQFPRPTDFAGRAFGEDGRKLASSESTESSNKTNSTSENNSSTSSSSTNENRTESSHTRIERLERVESGDAVQKELKRLERYALFFAISVLLLLVFIAVGMLTRKSGESTHTIQKVFSNLVSDPVGSVTGHGPSLAAEPEAAAEGPPSIAKRYETERLQEELTALFAQHPKVAKIVFTRVLTEEGVEMTAKYLHIFGEGIVVDMLRDPSLQSDLSALMEYYARNPQEIGDEEKLELLKKLHNRAVAGKLISLGSRSSHLFDFLAEMDGTQILELIRSESLTVKSIVLTQCDPQKRAAIYAQLDDGTRLKLMTELSRIDYLPRDYIFNVATALKRKRRDNPRLNTEALPGSDVLLTLLERSDRDMQKTVLKSLEVNNPDTARAIKGKLVTLDTLQYLRDSQLLEVVLSLKHEELLQFLKGTPADIRHAIFSKSPKDLVADLEEELAGVGEINRDVYYTIERKVLNRVKLMANDGLISLIESNDRMLSEKQEPSSFVETTPAGAQASIRKVAGW